MFFYDDFLISREVTKITSIYYLCHVKNREAMKRNITLVAVAAFITSAIVLSCERIEPPTYTETFHRIATVQYKEGKASLLIDCTDETYIFTNFVTASDMESFNVKAGDRVIAKMTMTAISNLTNNKLKLEALYPFPISRIAETCPPDSLNYRFIFETLNMGTIIYPDIWAQGHLINIAPTYIMSSEDREPSFHLYPKEVRSDTLVMQLYADIPDTISQWTSAQSLLCYDISSMRDAVSDSAEYHFRDSLLTTLALAKKETINVKIMSAEYLREKWRTNDGGVKEVQYMAVPRPSVTVSIPFDF